MGDTISRHGTSAWLENMGHPNLAKMVMDEKRFPSAQHERKRGKWVFKNDLFTVPTGYWECSECKEGRLLYEENFCPHCGADMREVTE